MKVKELKKLLEGVDENAEVLICDVADKCLQIVGGGELCCGNLMLNVRQEFPEEYYKDGEEIRWVNGKAVIPMILDEEVFDLSLTHSGIFDDNGDEHILTFEFHDGYALCRDDETIEMVYPKLCELTDLQMEEIDDYIGKRASDSGHITPGDVCLKLGAIRKRQWLVEVVVWLDSVCEVRTNCNLFKSREDAESFREHEWEDLKKAYGGVMGMEDHEHYFLWDGVNGACCNHACVNILPIFV